MVMRLLQSKERTSSFNILLKSSLPLTCGVSLMRRCVSSFNILLKSSNQGWGYVITPEEVFQYSIEIFLSHDDNVVVLLHHKFQYSIEIFAAEPE